LEAVIGLGADADRLPLWRAVTVVPQVVAGLGGVGGTLTALGSAAVVAASIVLGLRQRPDVVAVLVVVGGLSALAAWAVDRLGVQWLWAPAMLLPTALALAGLGVLAARTLYGGLSEHAFGARQLSVVVAAVVLIVGLVGGVARLAAGPWDGLAITPEVVPAFVGADTPVVGPYRVLLLADRGGVIAWTVTDAMGPSMVQYGAPTNDAMLRAIGTAVGGISGGGDPVAGATLGVANVRYVVVTSSGATAELADALASQPALEPLPTGAGRVYQVRSWLPRASVLPRRFAQRLLTTGDPGDTQALEKRGLELVRPGKYQGTANTPGLLILSEAASEFVAEVDFQPVDRRRTTGGPLAAPVQAWSTPAGSAEVRPTGELRHWFVLLAQALIAAGVVSLALRPPRFTQRPAPVRRAGRLPKQLQAEVPEVQA
jgi:hypothetical protein